MTTQGRIVASAGMALLLMALAARGQDLRPIAIRIDMDDKPILTALTLDNGKQPPEVVWRYLTKYPLVPVRGADIQPNADDPLRLTLKGKIVVDVPYGGKTEVSELNLHRKSEKEGWRMTDSEVEVMATRIGLPPAPAPPPAPPASTPKDEMKIGATSAPAAPPPTGSSFGGSIWVWLLGAVIVLVLIAAVVRAMPRDQELG